MINQQKKKKTKNKAIEVIIVVFSSIALGLMILGLIVLWGINPFDTKEKRQVKPIYRATMKGVPGFRLTGVTIDKEYNSVRFTFRLRNNTGSNSFTEEELQSINRAVEQLMRFLSAGNDVDYPYSRYTLKFQIGKTPIYINCHVTYLGGETFFTYLSSETSNNITDFHMMEDVRGIKTLCIFGDYLDKEKVEEISKFEKLEEIHFSRSVDEEKLLEFAKIINKNNPQCKIFVEGGEFVLPD